MYTKNAGSLLKIVQNIVFQQGAVFEKDSTLHDVTEARRLLKTKPRQRKNIISKVSNFLCYIFGYR